MNVWIVWAALGVLLPFAAVLCCFRVPKCPCCGGRDWRMAGFAGKHVCKCLRCGTYVDLATMKPAAMV